MIRNFTLFRCPARLRAPALAASILVLAGCHADEALKPVAEASAEVVEAVPVEDASPAALTRRGIPIGHFAQPLSAYGRVYNGGHKNFSPNTIVRELSAIRARGGRVIIPFAGSPRYYKVDGHFSLKKWKARVNRF